MQSINQVLSQESVLSLTRQDTRKDLARSNQTLNALDFLGDPPDDIDFVKAEALIESNFGIEFAPEKFNLLWDFVKEEKWSKERFLDTVKTFLKTKKFPSWTIADFFEFETPKLFPYSKYLVELDKNRNINDEIVWVKIENLSYWFYKTDHPKLKGLLLKYYEGSLENA